MPKRSRSLHTDSRSQRRFRIEREWTRVHRVWPDKALSDVTFDVFSEILCFSNGTQFLRKRHRRHSSPSDSSSHQLFRSSRVVSGLHQV
jgi:hypothetical protein